jgi:hypothetical protein
VLQQQSKELKRKMFKFARKAFSPKILPYY